MLKANVIQRAAITTLLQAVITQLTQLLQVPGTVLQRDIKYAYAMLDEFAINGNANALHFAATKQDSYVRDKYTQLLVYIERNDLTNRRTCT